MFEGCLEINDYITEIFRMGLKESFTQIIDNSEIDGYYLSIPSRDKSKVIRSVVINIITLLLKNNYILLFFRHMINILLANPSMLIHMVKATAFS